MSSELQCFSCGNNNPIFERVGRRDQCFKCHADLHVCKNCRFYDSAAYNDCHENSADRVKEKESSNFCDFFEPGSGQFLKDNKEDLVAQAEALFAKKD